LCYMSHIIFKFLFHLALIQIVYIFTETGLTVLKNSKPGLLNANAQGLRYL